jgi:hypothetical protein
MAHAIEHEPEEYRQGRSVITPRDILAELWALVGLRAEALTQARLVGAEPALPSSFRVGALAQAAIAASGLAAAELWRQRGGAEQEVTVDMRHAAVEFLSERLFTVDRVMEMMRPSWMSLCTVVCPEELLYRPTKRSMMTKARTRARDAETFHHTLVPL